MHENSSEFGDVPVFARLTEAAKLLKLSERKVWQMGKDRLIRTRQFGRSVRYCLREFVFRKGGC